MALAQAASAILSRGIDTKARLEANNCAAERTTARPGANNCAAERKQARNHNVSGLALDKLVPGKREPDRPALDVPEADKTESDNLGFEKTVLAKTAFGNWVVQEQSLGKSMAATAWR